jgi:large subunit ribosomal protein L31
MKPEIHPEYLETTVTCGCGEVFTTRSTKSTGSIYVEVCSVCHPFYTGKQRILDTGGRVAAFEKRFGKAAENKPAETEPVKDPVVEEAVVEEAVVEEEAVAVEEEAVAVEEEAVAVEEEATESDQSEIESHATEAE